MRDMIFAQNFLMPTLLLCVASALDFSKGKFPNFVFLASLVISSIWVYHSTQSLQVLGLGLLLSSVCIIVLFPLFLFNILGAGDIKLVSVVCLLTSWQTTTSILTYSLFWGLLIGLFKLALSGDLKNFLLSFYLRTSLVPHKIPYSIALLLGWLTTLQIGGVL